MKYKVVFEFNLVPTNETVNFLDQTEEELVYSLNNDFEIEDLMDWFPDFEVSKKLIND